MSYNKTAYSFADWKKNTSQDTHSLNVDPKFVSAGTNFHLLSTSPAINSGTNVSLTTDHDGNKVPNGSAPEIGAFEYKEIPFIPSPPGNIIVH
jgi:hypothetical protein